MNRTLLLSTVLSLCACDGKGGLVDNDGDGVDAAVDCDDDNSAVFPGASDVCDGVDNDCDSEVDEDAVGGSVYFVDGDADGFGSPAETTVACAAPDGFADNGDDCDDSDASVSPAGVEVCDGADNDCDGDADEDATDAETVYLDYDQDGFGSADAAYAGCEPPLDGDFVTNGDDCDDLNPENYPGAVETCDGVDNDCDGTPDNNSPTDGFEYYLDADGDGYGGDGGTIIACDLPDGYGEDTSDCDDGDDTVNPGADEVCGDGVDNNCDGGSGGCGISGVIPYTDAALQVLGAASSDYLARSGAVGDLDGDGVQDLLLGATGVDAGSTSSVGAAYLAFGPLTSGSIDGLAAVAVTGESSFGYLGWSSALVDLDGDGYDDLLSGAYGEASYAGSAWALYGPLHSVSLTTSDADLHLTGARASDYLGYAMASQHDQDGDGLEDVLVGAYSNDDNGSGTGAAYLFYGVASGVSGELDPSYADAQLLGESYGGSTSTYLGYSLAGGGDYDGDGVGDLFVGAYSYDEGGSDAGGAFVFLGAGGAFSSILTSSDADAMMLGAAAYDYLGARVAAGGDVDGDGLDDLLIGAYGVDFGSSSSVGMAFLVLGAASVSGLLSPTASLEGEAGYDYFGDNVAAGGDLNADGVADIVVGAYGEDSVYSSAGAAYTFLGPLTGSVPASSAEGKLTGPAGGDGYLGRTLPGPIDLNEDGTDDLVVGGYYVDLASYDAGALFGYLGGGL